MFTIVQRTFDKSGFATTMLYRVAAGTAMGEESANVHQAGVTVSMQLQAPAEVATAVVGRKDPVDCARYRPTVRDVPARVPDWAFRHTRTVPSVGARVPDCSAMPA